MCRTESGVPGYRSSASRGADIRRTDREPRVPGADHLRSPPVPQRRLEWRCRVVAGGFRPTADVRRGGERIGAEEAPGCRP